MCNNKDDSDSILIISNLNTGQVIGFISEQSLESLELSEDNVAELVVLADFLGIQDIIEECSDYMLSRITIDNVCGVWQFSLIYRIQNVEHKSFK